MHIQPVVLVEIFGTILGIIGSIIINVYMVPNLMIVTLLYAISAAMIAYVCYKKELKYTMLLMIFYTIMSTYGFYKFL